MGQLADYKDRYQYVKFERRDGVLQIRIHLNDGPAAWSSFPGGIHDELGDAFYCVGRDPDNKVVLLTGTGDEFLTEFDHGEEPSEVFTPASWYRIYKEGTDLLQNLLAIDVPVIGVANGPAFVHAELLTLSDIVIASDRASFADKAHMPGGVPPGDGAHVWWQMLLGPNRGRHFLLTGAEIDAEEAKQLGVVAEVVAHDQALARGWEVAAELAVKPQLSLRHTRIAFTQYIKRRMLDELGYGLTLEGMAIVDMMRAGGAA